MSGLFRIIKTLFILSILGAVFGGIGYAMWASHAVSNLTRFCNDAHPNMNLKDLQYLAEFYHVAPALNNFEGFEDKNTGQWVITFPAPAPKDDISCKVYHNGTLVTSSQM